MRTFRIKDSDVVITIDSKSDLTNKQIRSYLMQLVKVDELKDENEFIIPKEVLIYELGSKNWGKKYVEVTESGQLIVGGIEMSKSQLQGYLNKPKTLSIAKYSYDGLGHRWINKEQILIADNLDTLKDNLLSFMFYEDSKS